MRHVTVMMDIKHWIQDVKYATGFSHMEFKGEVRARNSTSKSSEHRWYLKPWDWMNHLGNECRMKIKNNE